MARFAQVKNGIVVNVIEADQEFVDSQPDSHFVSVTDTESVPIGAVWNGIGGVFEGGSLSDAALTIQRQDIIDRGKAARQNSEWIYSLDPLVVEQFTAAEREEMSQWRLAWLNLSIRSDNPAEWVLPVAPTFWNEFEGIRNA